MPDEKRSYWQLLEPHWSQLCNFHSANDFLRNVHSYPRPIVLLYATHLCQSEVCNGGLLQFFWNSTGVMAPEAVEGYQAIGMPVLAQVLEAAAAKLGPEYPRERGARWDALLKASPLSDDELRSTFSSAHDRFRAYYDATLPLGFEHLDGQFWKLAEVESGGFDVAATAYAYAPEPTLISSRVQPNSTSQE